MSARGMTAADRRAAILSEARVLIAEGEWGRGTFHRKVEVPGLQQVLAREGVTMTRTLDCYCVGGAVFAAQDNLVAEATRAGDRQMWARASVDAFNQLAQTATAMGLVDKRITGKRDRMVVVIQVNDRVVDNKDQALRWLDAAVADKPLGMG